MAKSPKAKKVEVVEKPVVKKAHVPHDHDKSLRKVAMTYADARIARQKILSKKQKSY